jgi:hypothetical protein
MGMRAGGMPAMLGTAAASHTPVLVLIGSIGHVLCGLVILPQLTATNAQVTSTMTKWHVIIFEHKGSTTHTFALDASIMPEVRWQHEPCELTD